MKFPHVIPWVRSLGVSVSMNHCHRPTNIVGACEHHYRRLSPMMPLGGLGVLSLSNGEIDDRWGRTYC